MSGDGWKQMPGQPKTCAGCGRRVKLRSEAVWLKTMPLAEPWHFRCRPRKTA